MKDRVLVGETEQGTTLRISAPNGASDVFLFFTEPETPEEAAAQAPYRLAQEVFTRGYQLGLEPQYYVSPLRYLTILAVILGVVLGALTAPMFGTLNWRSCWWCGVYYALRYHHSAYKPN